MPRRKDLTGQRFGRLVAIKLDEEKTKEKHQSYWICKCDCGNIKSIYISSLTRGITQSCGCLQKERSGIDITNQRFGNLVALYKIDSKKDKDGIARTYWHCKCDCGNECDVLTASLRNGDTQSCGCKLQSYYNRAENLTGKRFGKLVVLEKDNEMSKSKGHTYWKCQCDCGNIKSIYHTHLISGDTISCGCIKSKGETIIQNFLRENQIQYISEYWFSDLIGEGGAHLRYDFAIFVDNKLFCLIEYNGIQHYEAIEFWGGENQLNKQIRQDKRKKEYCELNNIPYLIFNYKENNETIERRLKEWFSINTKT